MPIFAGAGLGLSLIVAIGAQNVFVLRQGIRREHVLLVAAICAISDAILIAVGVYSGNNNLFDVGVVIALGVAGYLFAALGFPPAPLLLGFVLGPMVEENFRRALLLARGDFSVFFTRPLSGAFMAITIVMMLYVALRRLRRPRLAVPAVG